MIRIMAKPAHAPIEVIEPRAAPIERDVKTGRFLTGNRGGARPRGSRVRHSENLLRAFADDFELHGERVIREVRETTPAIYLKLAVDLLPKEATLDVSVDIVHRAQSQLDAFRLLRDASNDDKAALRAEIDDKASVG
jgi:hypothetical protein